MSWRFSLALVAEFSERDCLDSKSCARLKRIRTVQRSYYDDRKTARLNLSPYGMTLGHSTGKRGVARWISLLPDSRANLSRLLDNGKLRPTIGICGLKLSELFAKLDHRSSSWKTSEDYSQDLTDISRRFSKSWPSAGMMLDGECFRRPKWERRIGEIDSGYLPTPTVHGNYNRKGASKTSGDGLETAVKRWPTPTARDWREGGYAADRRRNSPGLPTVAGGPLNPSWVELLMGLPDGWTCFGPISHVDFLQWLMGFSCEANSGKAEALRILRFGNVAKEIQREIGRPIDIPASAILLSQLCQQSIGNWTEPVFQTCEAILKRELRSVRGSDQASDSSYRSGWDEQRSAKPSNSMQAMSRFLAQYGPKAWRQGSWEDATLRVANGVPYRVHRLRAIGNAQVPEVVRCAWESLINAYR